MAWERRQRRGSGVAARLLWCEMGNFPRPWGILVVRRALCPLWRWRRSAS